MGFSFGQEKTPSGQEKPYLYIPSKKINALSWKSISKRNGLPKYKSPIEKTFQTGLGCWFIIDPSFLFSDCLTKGPFIYYVSTWRGEGGSKNCPYCLFSVQKIFLHRRGGGQKSPKLCLRNIWMVPNAASTMIWIMAVSRQHTVQVNLFQKHLFLHQLTHNMTKDCSLIYQFSKYMKTTSSEHVVYINCFECHNMFWACSFHVLNW